MPASGSFFAPRAALSNARSPGGLCHGLVGGRGADGPDPVLRPGGVRVCRKRFVPGTIRPRTCADRFVYARRGQGRRVQKPPRRSRLAQGAEFRQTTSFSLSQPASAPEAVEGERG